MPVPRADDDGVAVEQCRRHDSAFLRIAHEEAREEGRDTLEQPGEKAVVLLHWVCVNPIDMPRRTLEREKFAARAPDEDVAVRRRQQGILDDKELPRWQEPSPAMRRAEFRCYRCVGATVPS